jgi:hypothetical protein
LTVPAVFDPFVDYLVVTREVGDDIRHTLALPNLSGGQVAGLLIQGIGNAWKPIGHTRRTYDGWECTGETIVGNRRCRLTIVRGMWPDGRAKMKDKRRTHFATQIEFLEDTNHATA